MSAETPEEFWHENIKKYQKVEDNKPIFNFPAKLTITQLIKLANNDVAVFRGSLKNGDLILLSYPTNNKTVKNFIGVSIADREYLLDQNTQVFPLDYTDNMNDDILFDLLVNSYGWCIKDYGDLSVY